VTIDGNTGTGSGRCAEINLFGFNQTLAGLTNITRTSRQQRVVNSDISAAATLTISNTGGNVVFTNGAGNFASWVHRFHQHHGLAHGHKVQLAPTVGSMGYGVPAGIAANILTGRTVFTIAGDGDFLMNGQELATAVQFGAKTIIVLLNNGVYGTIRMHQEREFPTHQSGSTLNNPSFAELAKAYGYVGVRITRTQEFEAAFKEALTREQGTLIEVMIDADIITTRGTLSAIRDAALAKQAKS
jgi:acetolactate synthase-1/2/3 large subunit